jgi:hypothetical protein
MSHRVDYVLSTIVPSLLALCFLLHPRLPTFLACVLVYVLDAGLLRFWRRSRSERGAGRPRAALRAQSFLLLALGTRGDVQPMLATAKELLRRHHRVTLMAAGQFKALVESHDVSFKACGIDSFESQEGWLAASSPAEFMATVAGSFLNSYAAIGQALFQASVEADCVLTNHAGIHVALDVADKTGVAVWTLHLMPEGTTWLRPPFGEPASRFGQVGNRLKHLRRLWGAVRAAHQHSFTPRQNAFRAQVLGLGPVKLQRLEDATYYMPSIHAYSGLLAPRPSGGFSPSLRSNLPARACVHACRLAALARGDGVLLSGRAGAGVRVGRQTAQVSGPRSGARGRDVWQHELPGRGAVRPGAARGASASGRRSLRRQTDAGRL